MRNTIVLGKINKITGGDHSINAREGNIINNAATTVSQLGDSDGVSYGQFKEVSKIEERRVAGPWMILHGSRIKEKNRNNNGTATDLLYNDYPENEVGIEKLRSEIYLEEFRISKNKIRATELAEDRISQIKFYLGKSNNELFEIFRSKINNFALGTLDNLTQTYVNRMESNKGGYISSKALNSIVMNHPSFVQFATLVEHYLQVYLLQGNSIESLKTSLDENAMNNELYKILKNAKVPSIKFNSTHDKINGLTILINDLWAYELQCLEYVDYGMRLFIKLKYSLYDHFGLDYPDIHKYNWEVFYVWFVLQHFRGYKPMVTQIEIEREARFFAPNK